jgi:hypothetical protein
LRCSCGLKDSLDSALIFGEAKETLERVGTAIKLVKVGKEGLSENWDEGRFVPP